MSKANDVPWRPGLHPGLLIRAWCIRNDIPQYVLAGRMGVSAKHLNQIINGHNLYSARIALKLAGEMEIPVEELGRIQWLHLVTLASDPAWLEQERA